jgi:glyoxylase-like metal-dependent hydrolase (beta-lactamase superfamily II)
LEGRRYTVAGSLTLDWFRITQPSPGVFAIQEPLQRERVLSYLVVADERALLIDTGTGAGSMKAAVETVTDLPVTLVNSHTHWDHVGSNHEFTDIAVHRAEAHELAYRYHPDEIARFFAADQLLGPLPPGRTLETITIGPSVPTLLLDGGETFDLGGRTIQAIHTPGHAPGLLSFYDEANGVLLTTDTAYPGPLYAYSDETNLDVYIRSMDSLADLVPNLKYVHPSHNADLMDAALLPKMRDALIEVRNGKRPDRVDDVKATYDYDGFGIYGPLPRGDR